MRPLRTPARVLRIARDTLVATRSGLAAATAAGVHVKTVLGWNRRYGWVRMRRDPMAPKRWRCCGRINLTERCPECGYVPAWVSCGIGSRKVPAFVSRSTDGA